MKKTILRLKKRSGLLVLLIAMVSIVIVSRCGVRLSGVISFVPTSGPVGTLVTITGTDFSTVQSVSIGGVPAIPVSLTESSLVAFVMPGALSGQVSFTTTADLVLNSPSSFIVTATGVPSVQQGSKLIGSGAIGSAQQGASVSLSADGNTALIGGPDDNIMPAGPSGASWVFIRNGITWTQQGLKLVANDAVSTTGVGQGRSVSLSADGNTALIGGYQDNSNVGATWVFTRSGGVWTQQGSKLVGSDVVGGAAFQGYASSLSADGNTALVGGYQDNSNVGATWVFARSGGVWAQQGSKLVGTGAIGPAQQGSQVSLSADGNTALVGGITDNGNIGASWVFVRTGSVWKQQGSKLVGSDIVGSYVSQGYSVSLSADGNTALIGGYGDTGDLTASIGASWVFTRTEEVWTQQGLKLVGTGGVGSPSQGRSVSLTADGNTALIGGRFDTSSIGASWVFTRRGEVWTQQGTKLVGTSAIGASEQGFSVSLSADGNIALIGGWKDNFNAGAIWVF